MQGIVIVNRKSVPVLMVETRNMGKFSIAGKTVFWL